MERNREFARNNGYDCFCYSLLCAAALAQVDYVARGWDCFVFSETYSSMGHTVYYLAHKRVNQRTRTERGCSL